MKDARDQQGEFSIAVDRAELIFWRPLAQTRLLFTCFLHSFVRIHT